MHNAVRLAIAAKACVAAILVSASGGPAAARPEVVSVELGYPAGSIVIVNSERKVYYVTGGGKAIRYGVAVGKESELLDRPHLRLRKERGSALDSGRRRAAGRRRRSIQSARQARALSRLVTAAHPRYALARLDRGRRVEWLHPHAQ